MERKHKKSIQKVDEFAENVIRARKKMIRENQICYLCL
jgi:hypothetical protein